MTLREVLEGDLSTFYEHQRDPEACRIADFSSRGREAFMEHWAKILANEEVTAQTVLVDGELAGNMVCFEQAGLQLVGYWLGRSFWGKGFATEALRRFLRAIPERPLHAFVAQSNRGSIRVLEKAGFVESAREKAGCGEADRAGELLFRLER